MCKRNTCLVFAFVALGLTGNVSASLVLHLPLEDAANPVDVSANPAAIVVHGALTSVDAKIGKGLEFDGNNANRLEVTHAAKLEGMSALSVAAWVRPRNIASHEGMSVVSKRTAYTQGDVYNLFVWTGRVVNARVNGVGASALLSTTVLEDNNWYHLAFIFDGKGSAGEKTRLYINGVLEARGDHAAQAVNTGGAPVWIGELDAARGFAWDGIIDEVRIYDRALSQVQVFGAMIGKRWPYAYDPEPANGTLYENTWISLAWKPGELAVSHDVYIGESFDDVNNGAAGTFRGNQSSTSLFVGLGLPGDPYPGGLVPGTAYYWRIDEVNTADPNSPWKGPVWSFLVPPRKAYNPGPPDGAKYIATTGTTLSWTAGMGAKVHTVYFGDNLDTISNAAGGAFQSQTTFNPGTLQMDKTYYWRVDEFDGAATHKGDVWSFTTTLPSLGAAVVARWNNITTTNLNALKNDPRYPNSPDVTEMVTRFAWDGPDADNYGGRIEAWLYVPATGNYTFWLNTDDQGELWLSTDDDSGNVRLIAKESSYTALNTWGAGEERSQPIPLVGGQKYYIMALWKEGTGGDHCQAAWQGPGIATRTIIPGGNLSPYEPLNAYGAIPANGATGVSQTPILQWKPGLEAASSEVYFGTDPNAVKNATKSSPEFKGVRALGAESYSPGTLGWQTTYYWRVDEVNAANPDSPWIGSLWSFTTADFLIVDDIESYNDLPETDPASNRIYKKWIDGFGTLTNGALVGNIDVPLTERGNVHGGAQAMPLSYDNNLKFSEATLTLTGAARDWTREGVGELSLWFRGLGANAAERMYVALNGTAVIYNDDMSLTQKTAWTQWVIPLQQFADKGVNLTNVTSITIGFGTRGNTTAAGGTGRMYIDDIRLYRPRNTP